MSADFDPDPFTEALREDLPSPRDEARVRARLATAGVLAGVGAVAPGATAAATTSTATAGVFTKLLALPLAIKLGATALVVGAVAVPAVRAHSHATASVRTPQAALVRVKAPAVEVRAAAAGAVATAVQEKPSASSSEPSVAVAPVTTAAGTPAVVAASLPAASRVERVKSRDAAPVPVAVSNGASASVPAVSSFPIAATEDEGTLRAETTLMEQALGAIRRGDLATAKQKLAEHARTFPNGHLAPERDRALERIREKETAQ